MVKKFNFNSLAWITRTARFGAMYSGNARTWTFFIHKQLDFSGICNKDGSNVWYALKREKESHFADKYKPTGTCRTANFVRAQSWWMLCYLVVLNNLVDSSSYYRNSKFIETLIFH